MPTREEAEEEIRNCSDINAIKERINEVIEVLADFKARRGDDRPRTDYIYVLKINLMAYYDGYNEFLMNKFMELFPNASEV